MDLPVLLVVALNSTPVADEDGIPYATVADEDGIPYATVADEDGIPYATLVDEFENTRSVSETYARAFGWTEEMVPQITGMLQVLNTGF